jgi:EF-P beta-lysylation protein EpmB
MPIRSSQVAPTPAKNAPNGELAPSWREAMKRAIRRPEELLARLDLPADLLPTLQPGAEQFPVFVPLEFLARMQQGNPRDPLLLQVLPQAEEMVSPQGFREDAVGDLAAELTPGLVRKYRSRALLIASGACAVNCRYCFRRHYPYSEAPKSIAQWEPALERIAEDPSIDEVILSGGDPLTLVDNVLAMLVERIAAIDHVRRLRVHTRLPIVIPQRVDDSLLGWLKGTRLVPWMVVHINHPAEIDSAVERALSKLVDAGIPVLNQSVVLKGVNDSASILVELSQRLVDLRVIPYYLHQLDRVRGTAHFEVPVARGMLLVEEMRKLLPGYAVPRYVREVAGDESKRVLT